MIPLMWFQCNEAAFKLTKYYLNEAYQLKIVMFN